MDFKRTFLTLSLLVGTSIVCACESAFAVVYSTKAQIMAFGGTNLWQATEMILTPTSEGRYKTESNTAAQLGGTCNDYLSDFQKRPLEAMRTNNYITQETYDFLLHNLKDKVDPRQFLLVTLFSDVPSGDISALFPGMSNMNNKRILKEWTEKDGSKWTRVSRGTLFAIRGQALVVNDSWKLDFVPKKTPWEFDKPLASHLERPFDREKVPFVVEIGRAHSESDVLPGDLKLAVHILMSTLETEFSVLGVPPKKVVITGHFLDPKHTRFFTRHFPLRPLTIEVQGQLENNFEETIANYMSIQLPKKHTDWIKMADTLTFGSLEEMLKVFPSERISDTAHEIVVRSGGKIPGNRALDLVLKFFGLLRDDYDYYYSPEKGSKGPIMIRERGTAIQASKFYNLFKKEGLSEQDLKINDLGTFIGALYFMPEVDAFTESYVDNHVYLRVKSMEAKKAEIGIEVSNVDDVMAMNQPIRYLASIILSIKDQMRFKIENATPETYKEILRWTNDARGKNGLPQVNEVTADNYFEVFPLAIGTTTQSVAAQLSSMGGIPKEALGITIKLSEGRNGLYMGQDQGYFFEFLSPQIKALESVFKDLDQNARNRLKPAVHDARLKMLSSGYK